MASPSLRSILATSVFLFSTVFALDAQLVGTWTTKSAQVFTGPGFYNPINDSFIEPSHTGISYSFTTDGYYEEAYYRAISNPVNPACPQAILQFQHGTITENADGSLLLMPYAVDGREQLSDPCQYTTSSYTRYNQTETMQKYQVYTDPYKQVLRLDLYQFDGSPLPPMYLAYKPPMMLPTQTMNPTASGPAPAPTGKSKRSLLDGMELPLNKDAKHIKRAENKPTLDANLIWWVGLGMTAFGGVAYLL